MPFDYTEAKAIVKRVQFETGEQIDFGGLTFLLFPGVHTESDKESGNGPVFFKPSTEADYDIYFGRNVIPEEFRRPCLLHELTEAFFFEEAGRKTVGWTHTIAADVDQRYAAETLSSNKFQEYMKFREELKEL